MIALAKIPDLTRDMRRARLLAARNHPSGTGSVIWRGIIGGQWDGGEFVGRHLATASPAKEG